MTFAEQIFKSELVGSVLLISSTLAFVSKQPQFKSPRGRKLFLFRFLVPINFYIQLIHYYAKIIVQVWLSIILINLIAVSYVCLEDNY